MCKYHNIPQAWIDFFTEDQKKRGKKNPEDKGLIYSLQLGCLVSYSNACSKYQRPFILSNERFSQIINSKLTSAKTTKRYFKELGLILTYSPKQEEGQKNVATTYHLNWERIKEIGMPPGSNPSNQYTNINKAQPCTSTNKNNMTPQQILAARLRERQMKYGKETN